ncbi:MAG: hypothetical protein C5B52_16285 [Bacteroidetes bacterium]|nr:MAG: hypothetical protein C5B52_16285 [Bacteroidota bacterium]
MKYLLAMIQSGSVIGELICLFYAIIFTVQNKEKSFLGYIYLYLSLGLMMDLIWWTIDSKIANRFYLLFLLSEFSFFSIWFYRILSGYSKVVIIFSLILFCSSIFGIWIDFIQLRLLYCLLLFESIYIVLFSFYYLYLKLHVSSTFTLIEMREFWALTGAAVCFVISIPFYCLDIYFTNFNLKYALNFSNEHIEVLRLINSIPLISDLFMYLFLIKAFKCKLPVMK